MAFSLHPQLEKDTIPICELGVCKLLLMNDRRYIWTILVPRIRGATELHILDTNVQNQIFAESMKIAKIIGDLDGVEKINIGALGNVVSQLHIHIIGRNQSDFAWPAPVWGNGQALPYIEAEDQNLIAQIKAQL